MFKTGQGLMFRCKEPHKPRKKRGTRTEQAQERCSEKPGSGPTSGSVGWTREPRTPQKPGPPEAPGPVGARRSWHVLVGVPSCLALRT